MIADDFDYCKHGFIEGACDKCEIARLTRELGALQGVILRNCDPVDATPEDAKIIEEIARRSR